MNDEQYETFADIDPVAAPPAWPEREYMPPPAVAAPKPAPLAPSAAPGPQRRRSGSGALILLVSLLSAGLSSVGTAAIVVSQTHAPVAVTAAPASPAPSAGGVAVSTTSGGTPTPSPAAGDIVTAAAKIGPSVVTITSAISSGTGRGATQGTGVGSGVIYTTNGYILTNAHVVTGATSIKVTLSDGREFTGTVAKSNAAADLAVVKINAAGLPAAEIGKSSALEVGQSLLAVGSPLGTYSGSVTSGILSGVGRSVTVANDITGRPETLTNLLQTDAAINPGNSGGPLVDLGGRVVGINTASSGSAEGIGFAIAIDSAATIMAQAQTVA